MSIDVESDGRSVRAREKREKRRRHVLNTALHVFSTNGYHATRVSDIIDEAGIARGTFYLYFDSKNAIFHELLDLLLSRLRANVVGIDLGEGAPPVRAQLLATVRRVLDAFRENPAVAKFVLKEAVGIDAELDEKIAAFDRQLHAWIAESLRQGVHLGLLRAIDPELVAWLILGSFKQCMSLALDHADGAVDLNHLAEVILDYNLQGILVT